MISQNNRLFSKILFGFILAVFYFQCTFSAFAQEEIPANQQQQQQAAGQQNQQAATPTQAQPAMRNIFLNVLWGAATGAVLGVGVASLESTKENQTTDEKYSFSNLSVAAIQGATYGSFAGLLAGLYFSYTGVTFDENGGTTQQQQQATRIVIPHPFPGEREKFLVASGDKPLEEKIYIPIIHFRF
ncbi:MAG: cell division protein FtsN [bacterium]|jgi:cell division protein FtsN